MTYTKQLFRFSFKMLLVCMFFTTGMWSQSEQIAFEKYGVEEGLPEPWITSVIQDDKGFIWLSTQNGLVKYDGYDFKVYRGDSYKKDNSVNELTQYEK